MKKTTDNAMDPTARLRAAPRCWAKTRRGTACQSPAMRNRKRCRIHGGANPGAPKGNQNAYRHGMRSTEAAEMKSAVRVLLNDARQLIERAGE